MHPSQLPGSTKLINTIAGLAPPIWTWAKTGSWKTAIAVFLIGFVAGHVISSAYLKAQFPASKRNAEGGFNEEAIAEGTRRAMPVFLWAGPICGALAAIYFVYG